MSRPLLNIFIKLFRALIPKKLRDSVMRSRLRTLFVQSSISDETLSRKIWRKAVTKQKPTLLHLDVHVTDHCNLKCKGCEHYSSIAEPCFCDVDSVLSDLSRLSLLFQNIERIWLLGGEPLLHPDINRFISGVRNIFPNTDLCVMTNGILVTRMDESFWETMHRYNATLLCDSYPINIDSDAIAKLCIQHDVRLKWMPEIEEFFKIPLDVSGSSDPKKSFAQCRNLSNCAIVRDGHMYPCAHIAYADIPAEKFNLPSILPTPEDSISIYGTTTGDDIIDFLMHPAPWCKHCDFSTFTTYSWGQSTGDASEWIKDEQ